MTGHPPGSTGFDTTAPMPNTPVQHNVASALSRAAHAIGLAPELALACHVTPDGDALGSMLALHHLAASAGKRVVTSWPDPFVAAACYRSIPGLGDAVASSAFPTDPACMLTFDCGSIKRLNELGVPAASAAANGELIVLDHHATNECFGTINVVDPTAAATAVVVRELARVCGWPLTRESACCLYVGLITDTGRFQYSSTTQSVFTLAEELAGFDLPIAQLSRELFGENRFAYLQLASAALARAELDVPLRFVSTTVTLDDQRRHDVRYEEIEGLIEWVRSTAEAEVACVCKEAPDGVRVSLRSVSEVDVGAIAASLGGGGHSLAAGFTMKASTGEIIEILKQKLRAVPSYPR